MAGILPAENTAFIAVCKKAYKPLFDENDLLLIQCDGAIRCALEAMNYEDAKDDTRAVQKWAEAREWLVRAEENETSPQAQGTIQLSDDFNMENVSVTM